MRVGKDGAIRGFQDVEPAHIDLLPDLREQIVREIRDGLPVRAFQALELLERLRLTRGDQARDRTGERGEIVAPSDEVRLAIDLQDHAGPSVPAHAGDDHPLLCSPVSPLLPDRSPLLPQGFDRRIQRPACLLERMFTVHHPRARHIAEFLDHLMSDCHGIRSEWFRDQFVEGFPSGASFPRCSASADISACLAEDRSLPSSTASAKAFVIT